MEKVDSAGLMAGSTLVHLSMTRKMAMGSFRGTTEESMTVAGRIINSTEQASTLHLKVNSKQEYGCQASEYVG